jgi:hypothetical protein
MRRRDRGWTDNPLVPISGKRLHAAIIESDISVARLARKVGMKQPTLQYVVAGRTRRCRASNRAALALEFGVQEAWLEGRSDSGPFHDRQLARAKQQGTTVLPDELRVDLPPLAELRAARLIEACLTKWEQDLRKGIAPPPKPESLLGQVRAHYKGQDLTLWLGSYLESLVLSARTFRSLLYRFPQRLTETHSDLLSWYLSQDERFTAEWIRAVSELLKPWIEGRRQLDYTACYSLLERLRESQGALLRRAKRGGALRGVGGRLKH